MYPAPKEVKAIRVEELYFYKSKILEILDDVNNNEDDFDYIWLDKKLNMAFKRFLYFAAKAISKMKHLNNEKWFWGLSECISDFSKVSVLYDGSDIVYINITITCYMGYYGDVDCYINEFCKFVKKLLSDVCIIYIKFDFEEDYN